LGWTVHVNRTLLSTDSAKTERALQLLKDQLDEIARVVPENSVTELKKVSLWFSPEYAGTPPRAEYHPGAGWLRDNNRDPGMVKWIETIHIRSVSRYFDPNKSGCCCVYFDQHSQTQA
jgi:dipeptidyl-peptidase-4